MPQNLCWICFGHITSLFLLVKKTTLILGCQYAHPLSNIWHILDNYTVSSNMIIRLDINILPNVLLLGMPNIWRHLPNGQNSLTPFGLSISSSRCVIQPAATAYPAAGLYKYAGNENTIKPTSECIQLRWPPPNNEITGILLPSSDCGLSRSGSRDPAADARRYSGWPVNR